VIDVEKYDIELIHQEDIEFNEILGYLNKILNDRSIPEENKQDVKKQFDHIMLLKQQTTKPPLVVLKPKE